MKVPFQLNLNQKGASLKPEEEKNEKGKDNGSETPGHEEAV